MARIIVLRHDKGKLPPSNFSDEVKVEMGKNLGKFFKEHPELKSNGLWVNEDGVGICDWEAPDVKSVKDALDGFKIPYDEVVEVKKII